MSGRVEVRFLQAIAAAERGALAGQEPEISLLHAAKAHGIDHDALRSLWLQKLVAAWAARQQLEATA